MPDKEQVLGLITSLARQGAITREEVLRAFDASGAAASHPPFPATEESAGSVLTKRLGAAELLYYIGGAIVCVGIGILVWQNWSQLNEFTRLLATLGSAVAAYVVGLLFSRDSRTKDIGTAFFMISGIVMPLGLGVAFQLADFNPNTPAMHSLMSALLVGVFLTSLALFGETIFALFSILFGTWFFFAFTSHIVGGLPIFDDFAAYRVLVVGATYLLLGYSLAHGRFAPLSGFLYGFGSLGFLGAALWLGGWTPDQNIFWELVFPGLVFGGLFIGVQIKSRAFLAYSTIFLMIYIGKITGEYFSGSLGWPLALVLAGLTLIATGYFSLYLNKKYL